MEQKHLETDASVFFLIATILFLHLESDRLGKCIRKELDLMKYSDLYLGESC